MHDGASFAMHEMRGANHATPEGFADCLVPEANAEHRNFVSKMPDEIDADAGFPWRARAGREHNPLGTHGFDFFHRDLIVSPHLDSGAEFSKVLHQVVGERIVVVENEDHRTALPLQITPRG